MMVDAYSSKQEGHEFKASLNFIISSRQVGRSEKLCQEKNYLNYCNVTHYLNFHSQRNSILMWEMRAVILLFGFLGHGMLSSV